MSEVRRRRLVCTFGGGAGGASGFQRAKASLFGLESEFELVGSFDKDPYACAAFEYLTGVAQVCIDARELTPCMMRDFYGKKSPYAIHGSPPCVGYSKLLSTKKSKTKKYQLYNELALVNTRLIIETWGDDLPAFVLYENVPNIKARGKVLLAEVRRLLVAAGYVIQDGFHECRKVGNLAQRRKRWFLVARNPEKVPAFLYLPPNKPGKVCADVLDELPMPNDPAGGPMHMLPEISALNWWRLWAIPAGGDWRDLLPDDGTPRRARFRRHHLEKWTEPSVTIGGTGSNGPCGVADPRDIARQTRFDQLDKVTPWNESSGAIADSIERHKEVIGWQDCARVETDRVAPSTNQQTLLGLNLSSNAHLNLYKVTPADEPTGAVTGARRPGQGAVSIAAPTNWHHGSLGVFGWEEAAPTVTGAAGRPTTGRSSVAAPVPLALEPQAGNAGRHYDKYAVRPWDMEALTVHGATRVGSGAPSVAQPLATKDTTFHEGAGIGRWGVLAPGDMSSTVTANARLNTGPFSIAAAVPTPLDLIPAEECYDKAYAVIDRNADPSNAIAGNSAVGCGTYSITDDIPAPLDLTLDCAPRAGAYGVIAEVAPTVTGSASIDNSAVAIADAKPIQPPFVVLSYEQAKLVADGHVVAPFAIVDPDYPNEPLAIVEDMAKPPFRWVETRTKRGKVRRRKVVVPLVLISADGTWHRPLTTLELGVLQGLEWKHRGRPLDFGGGSTKQRELIGNMVPSPVGEAMALQMLVAGLASEQGCYFMAGGGGGLWVRPEQVQWLLAAGVRRVRQQDFAKVPRDHLVLLDDAAPAYRVRRPTTHAGRRRAEEQAQAVARRVLAAAEVERAQARPVHAGASLHLH